MLTGVLSENKMVRNAVKRLYEDVCTVYNADDDGNWKIAAENIPCRISYDSINYAKQNGSMERSRFTRKNLIPALEISAVVRLFFDAEILISAGSRICVIHGNSPLYFRAAGYSAAYTSHNEVLIVPIERFA